MINKKTFQRAAQFKLNQFLLVLALMLLNPIQAFNAFAEEANSEFMTRMAVFPFQNQMGDRALDWASIALQESMNVDLWYLPVGLVEPLPNFDKEIKNKCPNMAIECVASLEKADWLEIAENKGYRHFIGGAYRSHGDTLEIHFYLLNVENKTQVARHTVNTHLERLTEASSDALIHLMKQVNLTLANSQLERVKYLETKNVIALKNNALGFWAQQQYSVAENDHKKQILEKSWKEFLQKATEADSHYANAWNNLGWHFYVLNNKEQAKKAFEHAININSQHPDVLDGLASIYRDQNDQSQYIRHLEKVSQISWSMPNLNSSLADLYLEKGEYTKAGPLYQHALAVVEKALGSEHPNTASSLDNLARLYQAHGEYAKAESLFQRALTVYEKTLGSEHPHTALSLDNLAALYQIQGEYAKAEPLYQRALSIREKALGAEHPHTATSLNNLATSYRDQGEYAKAEPLSQRTLTIYEKTLGPEHPHTATILNNLAALYRVQGEYAKAEPLYQHALAIFEKALGLEHPHTASIINNLSALYQIQGEYAKAEPLYQRALSIREKALGAEHPHTATSLNNLATLYRDHGEYAEAEPLSQRTLAILEKVLGLEHPHTALSLNNLAVLYRDQGEYAKAEPLSQRALVILERVVGEKHPDTAQILFNYARLHHDLDQTTLAIFYGKRAINVLQASRESNQQLSDELRKSFLKSHELMYRTVADWLLEAGRLAEAEQVLFMLKEDEHYQYLRRNQSAAKTLNTRTVCTRWEEEHCQYYQQISNDLREVGRAWEETEKQISAGVEVEQKRLNELQQRLKTRKSAFDKGLEQINTALSAWQGNPEYKLHVEKDILQRSNRLRRSLKELGHGAVSLHYLLMDDGVRIILTTPDKQLTRNSAIKLATLRRKVGAMRQALLRQQEQVDYKALSEELYALLISPVADELAAANAQTLMVSLDDILRYLPFAALYDGQQFLIERYAVNFQTLAARTDLNIRPQPNWQISGFGVSQAADVVDPVTLKPINFVSLPFVATELMTLIRQNDKEAGLLPGEIYLDDAFSKQKLTQVLTREQPSPVIHIGSHFELRPGDNSRSFLLLGQNTILTMAEVYDENLDFSGADLVTLSACDTAMGEDNALSNGAEIESFGVLVKELGAKSVMATLWPVIDESTSFFMKRFYQLREQNKFTKAEALRQAQLSLITSGDKFSQSYYWAPFVLMGNWL
ncbi:CHAT domain-containing protein [Nitrosomonas ureae]|uniref:CHAT domain-containing protein n=1 Tax=Nitrosomonas ureae TaxID=44577 RepID=UPI000D7754E3|nr:tetratricopeptide repeat protein [Nitrosomonas ureae]PXX14300.1 CHAT domain-containing protein [Nitrosomonas ureae]